ncbi:hypothetical protein [Piscibacillus salipiscarius]|uniref:hypothetical protein n=1 Tax=Piscibacillus salipiscarius TaxID=299480 RepID=UPI0006D115FC|nr:hypothetical protein [Piscibacillus salipiscarius]
MDFVKIRRDNALRKRDIMNRLLFYLYTSYALLFILNLFIAWDGILTIQGVIGVLALIFSIRGANRTYQSIGIVFLIIALALMVTYDLPFQDLATYFTSMALLLTLLYFIPFINHYMIVGGYEQSLFNLLQKIHLI